MEIIYHKSVLIKEIIHYLNLKPYGLYLDVTFGGGGHTKAILKAESTSKVIAMDWDTTAIEMIGYPLIEQFPDRLQLIWGNFAQVDKKIKKEGIDQVDGIIADFGTSQFQISQRPGFSIYKDSPLDMRMSPPHQKITAQEIINKASEKKLYQIFKQLGEEPRSRAIARVIIAERTKKKITTTRQLAQLIERIIPRSQKKIHPATRIFQALRIYVNKELDNITSFLIAAMRILKPGGRLVCISFHSLEDRLVKHLFKEYAEKGQIEIITPKVVLPSQQEIKENPSSRSARLRVAQKII